MNDLVPTEFYLFQNYPNPFKDRTTIKYCIAYKTKVRIAIYDLEGEMIDKLVDEVKEADTYEVEFSVYDLENGDNQVSIIQDRLSGIEHQVSGNRHPVLIPLFYQMKAGDYLSEKEMILIQEENKSAQSK